MGRNALWAAIGVGVFGISCPAHAGECPFEIPPDAIAEDDPLLVVTETCAQTEGALPRGPNGGCNGPKGPDGVTWAGTFAELPIGVTVTGTMRSSNGNQDSDMFVIRGLPPMGNFIVDYTLSADGPVWLVPSFNDSNLSSCFRRINGWHVARVLECGEVVRRKWVTNTYNSVSPEGVPQAGVVAFDLRLLNTPPTTQLPCGDGERRYWIRINEVSPISECEPLPDPPGVLGVDWFLDTDPVHTTTYSGLPSSSGHTYDHCLFWILGCRSQANPDCADNGNEFLRLRPGKDMVGRTVGSPTQLTPTRSSDFYKFDVTTRSVLSVAIEAGSPYQAEVFSGPNCGIVEECTDPPGLLVARGGTLGHCGSRNDTVSESVVVEPGVYTVWVQTRDFAYGHFENGQWEQCETVNDAYNKYILRVDLAPAPQCEGDANADGVVDFNDITSVLSMWGTSYLPMPGSGIGDANSDGVVDFGDIVATLANWLGVCP